MDTGYLCAIELANARVAWIQPEIIPVAVHDRHEILERIAGVDVDTRQTQRIVRIPQRRMHRGQRCLVSGLTDMGSHGCGMPPPCVRKCFARQGEAGLDCAFGLLKLHFHALTGLPRKIDMLDPVRSDLPSVFRERFNVAPAHECLTLIVTEIRPRGSAFMIRNPTRIQENGRPDAEIARYRADDVMQ